MGFVQRAYRFAVRPQRLARLRAWMRTAPAVPEPVSLNTLEMRSFKTTLESYPSILYLEPCSVCNLRCPFCPTGVGTLGIQQGVLQPETFAVIVDKLNLDALKLVQLYNWGEPFLNKHVNEYVAYFSARGIDTLINANFSAKDYDDAFLRAVVQSGLTHLWVSIDGATQESYEKYRVRGNLERVLGNMRRLSAIKKALGSETPHLQYKMLLNKFNEHEVDLAAQHAASAGAELLIHDNFWMPDELRDEWESEKARESRKYAVPTSTRHALADEIDTECRQLWDSVLVNINGDVFPCCLIRDDKHRVGNLLEQSFEEIWNGPKMQALRRFVSDKEAPAPEFENFCEACPNRYCTMHSARATEVMGAHS